MNRRRYFAVLAEHAVADGRPLGDELSEALTAAGSPSQSERLAVSHARGDNLGGALAALGVDKLVAAAAEIEPKATVELGRRLRRMPGNVVLGMPLLAPVFYFGFIALFQLGAVWGLNTRILPTFDEMLTTASLPDHLAWLAVLLRVLEVGGTVLPWIVLVGTPIVVLLVGTQLGRRFLTKWSFWSTSAARTFTAAAVLANHGHPANESLSALVWQAGSAQHGIDKLTGTEALSSENLTHLADHLGNQAKGRARDTMAAIRVIGTVVLLTIAVCIIGRVYLTLPLFSAVL